jgi:glycosyltransferase involved in cell wall biosynthesis
MPVPTQSKKTPVAIVDWNTSGHHLTYLREYVLAFAERNIPVVVMSPLPPRIDPLPPSIVWKEIPTISWIKERKFLGSSIARWRFARHLAATMQDAEQSLGSRCSRVLFGCFYENQAKIATRVMSTLGRPYAGLYLQAGIFHSGDHRLGGKLARNMRRLLHHDMLDKIFMLDETMGDAVSAFSGKPVVHLPDVTDCCIEENHPLPSSLGLLPKTRPVIGLLGHLRPSKGVVEMIAFARSEPELDVSFLFAGSCNWSDFPPEEERSIKTACAEDPRIIFHPERISDEAGYNALICCCDVLWAVYRDTPHSSNTLAKAAFFERLVIVADGFQMAQQTRHYRLGEVVPQDDPAALRSALLPLIEDPAAWCARNSPRWDEFRMEKSNDRFRALLGDWAAC